MWISQKNEDQRRSQNPQQKTSDRSKTPLRVNKKFPKSARILRRSHFLSIIKQGKHFFGNDIRVEYRKQTKNFSPKLGITVSRRFGKAHERNRFKRVVREAFRELHSSLPPHIELHISPQKNSSPWTMMSILADLKALLEKIIAHPL